MTARAGEHVGIFRGTKQQILEVARGLFSDRSYLGVSMNDIAARLGMTKAGLYHHFSGKTELYLNVLEDVLSELRERLTAAQTADTYDEQLRHMVTDYLEFGMRERNLLNALVMRLSPVENDLREFITASRDEIVGLFRPVIDGIFATSQVRDEIDGGLAATMLTAMMDGLVLEHSLLETTLSPDRVSGHIMAILGLNDGAQACS